MRPQRIINMIRAKRFWHMVLLLALLGGIVAGGAVPALAQTAEGAPGLTLAARAGFDGHYRQLSPVPVQVDVANSGPPVEGELRVTIGTVASNDRVVYTAPISLPTQSNKRVTLYVDVPRYYGTLTVELRTANGRLLTETRTNTLSLVGNDAILYGVVSDEPAKLEILDKVTGPRRNAFVAFLSIHELPETAVAWKSLDVLLFHDVDTGLLTARQQEALQNWLRTGGQLVVTGGAAWQKSTAAFRDLLPVTLSGSESVSDLPGFAAQIGEPFRDAGPYVVATSSLRSGDLLYHEAGLPILARQAVGRGHVYFLALDPRLAPLADWDGSPVLWAAVAAKLPQNPFWWDGVQNSYSAYTAVSSLPSLTLPSVLGLVFFLLFYVLAVGPLNYWLLKRRGRRELAWVTVPMLVLVFSGAAYLTGFQLKGNDVILNQMSIVYGRVGGEPTRVQTLLGLYSPMRGTYDLALPADVMARPFERSYGAMGGSGSLDAVARSGDLVLENVRVDVSGMETFVVEAYRPGLPIMAQAHLNQDGGSLNLEVRVQNNSDTPLQNVTLLLGTQAVALGQIDPGQEKSRRQVVGAVPSGAASGAGPTYFGPTYGNAPLMANAGEILGTTNYYNDRAVYPRWQLLESLTSSYYSVGAGPAATPADTVTLVAWADTPQVEARLMGKTYLESATSLYLLEVPLVQNLGGSGAMTLPLLMLDWSVLDSRNVYGATVQNLYLSEGSVDFAYVPWSEFQEMAVTGLDLVLESQQSPPYTNPPELLLWDWAAESWVDQNVPWGVTAVTDYGRYLGPRNEVRLRVRTGEYGIEIREVYPQLTGNLQ